MNRIVSALMSFGLVLVLAGGLANAATVGQPAPQFTSTDSHGKKVSLSDFTGKYVVLEWHNRGCPYVRKHYDSGNMQKLQKEAEAKGVVWLTVISSAKGKQGYENGEQANEEARLMKASPSDIILDPSGTVGKTYGAKVTPHMFVIAPSGELIYNGAIDDKESTDVADVPGAKNYVMAALTESMAGKPVSVASTRPYGCGIKY